MAISPAAAAAGEYFSKLTTRLGGDVAVRDMPGRGKGLVLARNPEGSPASSSAALGPASLLFQEHPLSSLQHARNKPLVRACAHCMCFIGRLEDQFARAATLELPPALRASLPAEIRKTIEAEANARLTAEAGALPPAAWRVPALDDSSLTGVMTCACGAEFCSPRCAATAMHSWHALLCPANVAATMGGGGAGGMLASEGDAGCSDGGGGGGGKLSHAHGHGHGHGAGGAGESGGDDAASDGGASEYADVNAAELLSRQSLMTNEMLMMAAKIIGSVLTRWIENGNDLVEAMKPIAVLHSEPWDALFELRRVGIRERAAVLGDEVEEDDEEEDEDEDEEEGGEGGAAGGARSNAAAAGPDEDDEGARRGAARPTALQRRVREWLNDSLTILRSLIRERLPALVEFFESYNAQAAAAAAGSDSGKGGGGKGGAAGDAAAAAAAAAPRAPSRRALLEWEEEALFAPEFYSRIMGAIELNCIEVKIDSPVRS
jgi:hypothetical protein